MKALIINNHTEHIRELEKLFPGAIVINKEDIDTIPDLSGFDLLVISGGSSVPTTLNHPELYQKEMQIVRECPIPILGICLGAEIVVKAFGGELMRLDTKHEGPIQIILDDPTLKAAIGSDEVTVYEGHTIGVKRLPEEFTTCAVSSHGVEIFKRSTRPILGFQFHPEVKPSEALMRWAFGVLGIKGE